MEYIWYEEKKKKIHVIKNLFFSAKKKPLKKTHSNQQPVFVIISMLYLFVL